MFLFFYNLKNTACELILLCTSLSVSASTFLDNLLGIRFPFPVSTLFFFLLFSIPFFGFPLCLKRETVSFFV